MTTFKVLSVQQTREMDHRTIEGGFVSGEELMRRAGVKIAMLVAGICEQKSFSKDILLIAGKGNNGGDVFVAARILHELGHQPIVLLTCPESALQGDAMFHYGHLRQKPVHVDFVTHPYELEMELDQFHGDIIVDGLLGTGFKPPVSGFLKEIIERVNQTDAYVVAIDIPSGLDGDGASELNPEAVLHADVTLTIGSFKQGFLRPGVVDLLGRVIPVDIGFPDEIIDSFEAPVSVFTQEQIKTMLPRRLRSAHKGCFGHVLLFGGFPGFAGAISLAALGAQRSGAGLITVCAHPESRDLVHHSSKEIMTRLIPLFDSGNTDGDSMKNFLSPCDAIGIGPGLSTTDDALQVLESILQVTDKAIVLDADALNLIARLNLQLPEPQAPRIITPHPGEAARLLGCRVPDIIADRVKAAKELSEKYKTWVVLKGAHTLVYHADEATLHVSGTPAMASGGMGDILTGMITSFLGQGFGPYQATNLAVSLQGLAAEKLENETGPFGFSASECANTIPLVVQQLGRLAKKS